MKKSLGAKTIVHPTPVFVIGSYDAEDRPNMMAAAWTGICCSDPPCMGVSLRAATYTHGNIVRNQAFTVNVPSVSQAPQADYVGIYSGKDTEKFGETGLTPVKSDLVKAPYVEEFGLVAECKVIQTIEIGLHTQFIGQILDVKANEETLDSQGRPDLTALQPFVFSPADGTYYEVGESLGRAFSIGKREE
ncbi:MAG: flavin reductase family protein [Candidatus Hydrogenedentes bacterium]|jgi:flavin reductase (DIM6/NTAB) family NADH-FMN oxidoreductase RutF|nr:flavin reductase family protein [Candidatus Hydrogenedentota bacterium]